MDKIRLFCEGISDQRFLRDFLFEHYLINISDEDLKENNLIINLGSWNKLENYKVTITEEFENYHSLIIIDADNENITDKAGFEASKDYIKNLMDSWTWSKYDSYILPNNKDNGTIENLLENIINIDNKDIIICWESFENCLKAKQGNYNIPAKKSKIYSYLECLHGNTNKEKEKCKDKNRDFKDKKLWSISDLSNPYINNLKSFFDIYLT